MQGRLRMRNDGCVCIGLVVVECERLELAANAAMRHELPDWLAHRLAHIRAEAHSLRVEIEKTKGSENGRSTLRV